MTTGRDPPSGTSKVPGTSISFVPFSHTSNALTLFVDSRTCTTAPGGGALLPVSLPRPEPTSPREDPDFADPSLMQMAIGPEPISPAPADPADPDDPLCEIVSEPE